MWQPERERETRTFDWAMGLDSPELSPKVPVWRLSTRLKTTFFPHVFCEERDLVLFCCNALIPKGANYSF